jgi:hypothetical protein
MLSHNIFRCLCRSLNRTIRENSKAANITDANHVLGEVPAVGTAAETALVNKQLGVQFDVAGLPLPGATGLGGQLADLQTLPIRPRLTARIRHCDGLDCGAGLLQSARHAGRFESGRPQVRRSRRASVELDGQRLNRSPNSVAALPQSAVSPKNIAS